jgi:hypothetical protein
MIVITWFIAAFALGMLAVYVTAPPPEIIVKFPSPYNVGKVTYKDKSGECYKYAAERVDCKSVKSQVRPQPILEDFRQERHVPMPANF